MAIKDIVSITINITKNELNSVNTISNFFLLHFDDTFLNSNILVLIFGSETSGFFEEEISGSDLLITVFGCFVTILEM